MLLDKIFFSLVIIIEVKNMVQDLGKWAFNDITDEDWYSIAEVLENEYVT